MASSAPGPDPLAPQSPGLTFGGYAEPVGIAGEPFVRRLIARAIDLVVHLVISLISGFAFGIILGVAIVASGRQMTPAIIVKLQAMTISSFALAMLGYLFLSALQEAIHGSTVGKLCLGMTVVQSDGSPCRFVPALKRSIAYYWDSLFFGLIGYLQMKKTPKEQRYGDLWADTIVCARRAVQPQNLRGPGRFIVGLALAAMVDSATIMLGLLLKMF
jgi:uncharacterized RDD family membrane protein YckC